MESQNWIPPSLCEHKISVLLYADDMAIMSFAEKDAVKPDCLLWKGETKN